MNNNPTRKDLRLTTWDYATCATYHIVICTQERRPLLGSVVHNGWEASVQLTSIGEIARDIIENTPRRFDSIKIDSYVIMPNHIHILLSIHSSQAQLGNVIGNIKARISKKAKKEIEHGGLWQRGYYDHIIRNETDYQATLEYIANNPAKWAQDKLFVE